MSDGSLKGSVNSFTHPNGLIFKAIGLFFLCLMGFGSYFCYDNPAALKDYIKDDLNLDDFQFNFLYAVYSWPNVILGLFGGYFLDRVFSLRTGCNIYMGLLLTGQIVFATGGWLGDFWMMLLGRLIFGIGAESMSVAQNNYSILWFKGRALNMVFGLQLTVSRLGSTVNDAVMDGLYNWVIEKYQGLSGLGITLYIATLTCLFSFVCSLMMSFMDKRVELVLKREKLTPAKPVKLTDIRYFDKRFWFINVVIVFFYGALFPFVSNGKTFFEDQYGSTPEEANRLCALVYLISGIASPILGFLIDRIGRNVVWVTTGVALTFVAHILFTFFTTLNPYFGIVCMGLSSSIAASSVWPLISMVIPEYQMGTAYGVCSATQNSALALFPLISGYLIHDQIYTYSQSFYLCSLLVAISGAFMLLIHGFLHKDDILNMSAGGRIRYLEKLKEANNETNLDAVSDQPDLKV